MSIILVHFLVGIYNTYFSNKLNKPIQFLWNAMKTDPFFHEKKTNKEWFVLFMYVSHIYPYYLIPLVFLLLVKHGPGLVINYFFGHSNNGNE